MVDPSTSKNTQQKKHNPDAGCREVWNPLQSQVLPSSSAK
jgi:hypothetical protein